MKCLVSSRLLMLSSTQSPRAVVATDRNQSPLGRFHFLTNVETNVVVSSARMASRAVLCLPLSACQRPPASAACMLSTHTAHEAARTAPDADAEPAKH